MQPDPSEWQTCARCPKPSAGICCSFHDKELCHEDYRLTHFVEVCGCSQCDLEGLPRILKRSQPKPDQTPARPAGPSRVYAMPDPPTDPNARVRDIKGDVWVRGTDANTWVKPAGRTVPRYWGWHTLLSVRGPLTEVTDDHA